MKPRRGFFFEQVVMLLAVVIPLAMAEGVWYYLAAAMFSILMGWQAQLRHRPPPLGELTSRLMVIFAFGWLLVEHLWLLAIPVVALSHFMTLVCCTKFLQQRSIRDDAQLVVLSLLLLVVAAIISGSIVFLVALLISLTAGLEMMIRFSMAVEQAHVEKANAALRLPAGEAARGVVPTRSSSRAVTTSIGLLSVVAGILVFMFFPRVGAGMFGRVDPRGGGLTTTGFSPGINFETVGAINESERSVMRVIFETTEGPAPTGEPIYLRGRVYDYYGPRGPRGWDWQRTRRAIQEQFELERGLGREERLNLMSGYLSDDDDRPMLIAKVQAEPGALSDGILLAPYPPLFLQGVSADEVEAVTKSISDQIIRAASRAPRKAFRYNVYSPLRMDADIIRALHREREDTWPSYVVPYVPEPMIRLPEPALPAEDRIREILAPMIAAAGPQSSFANREKLARLIEDYLKSPRFTYTLSPPPVPSNSEPISQFLTDTHQGYCQHFASAMAIMCQLANIPARVVTGFRCDDYNQMGKFYSVRGKHAHAWVEAYIPGKDWVQFDPTPASGVARRGADGWLATLRGYSDYLQFQWATMVLTYDAEARRQLLIDFKDWLLRPARSESTVVGGVLAFVHELFTWRVQMTWQDRMLYWVFALLIVAMSVLIGYVIVVLSWRLFNRLSRAYATHRAGISRTGDAGIYHRFCRRLAALGLRRRPDQTPAEFAAELAAQFTLLKGAPELVEAHYQVVFGERSLSPVQRHAFETLLARLHSVDHTALQQAGAASV